VATFKLRDDREGNPVAHLESCFCPSMSFPGLTDVQRESDTWSVEADDIGSLAEELEEDAIADGRMTRGEARASIRIGGCIDTSNYPGVGRRFAGTKPTDALGEWERSVMDKVKVEGEDKPKAVKHTPPRKLLTRMAFQETDRKPGAPATSHSDCDHAVSKSARAKCRRDRAKK
jgi:hypothetical protein